MSDHPVRYGMIALDAAPTIVRLRGAPIIFHSPEETVEYAQPHDGSCQVGEHRGSRGRIGAGNGTWLPGRRSRGDFAPGLPLLLHKLAVRGCR